MLKAQQFLYDSVISALSVFLGIGTSYLLILLVGYSYPTTTLANIITFLNGQNLALACTPICLHIEILHLSSISLVTYFLSTSILRKFFNISTFYFTLSTSLGVVLMMLYHVKTLFTNDIVFAIISVVIPLSINIISVLIISKGR